MSAPTPDTGPVETAVSRQLTKEATKEPTPLPLPPVWTLPPPAVSAPTRMPTDPVQPSLTPFTLAPLATREVKKTAAPDERSITYSVTGYSDSVEITFVKPDGEVESGVFPLPFEKTLVFKTGAPLSLFGRIQSDFGTITCQVKSGEKVVKEATATGNNRMAFCSDITAE
ncbi:hypothetical protein hrd7_29070 [Leptolinea sp. HRD-7]|nr:hypothetical protein hrd7_29070 [Leptolinea sp. HRD-7]